MAFGLNRVELIGRLGADVTVNQLMSGGRVANLSIATDESYINRQTGDKVDKTEWHRVVTFQDGLIDMFEARHQGPAGLHRRQAGRGAGRSRRGRRPVLDRDPARPRRTSSWTSRAATIPGADPAAGDTGPPLRPDRPGPVSGRRFLPPHLACTGADCGNPASRDRAHPCQERCRPCGFPAWDPRTPGRCGCGGGPFAICGTD